MVSAEVSMADDRKRAEDKLLDVAQAARRLGVSRASVYSLIQSGSIKAAPLAPVYGYKIRVSEVERYKEEREIGLV
jgi:excisionase family DNA binding protein